MTVNSTEKCRKIAVGNFFWSWSVAPTINLWAVVLLRVEVTFNLPSVYVELGTEYGEERCLRPHTVLDSTKSKARYSEKNS